MNKRIEELAIEAGYEKDMFGIGHWNMPECERFVALIVAECIDSIKSWRDATDDEMDKDPHWQGYRSGCDDSIVEIQQRFGVENDGSV